MEKIKSNIKLYSLNLLLILFLLLSFVSNEYFMLTFIILLFIILNFYIMKNIETFVSNNEEEFNLYNKINAISGYDETLLQEFHNKLELLKNESVQSKKSDQFYDILYYLKDKIEEERSEDIVDLEYDEIIDTLEYNNITINEIENVLNETSIDIDDEEEELSNLQNELVME